MFVQKKCPGAHYYKMAPVTVQSEQNLPSEVI